MRKTRMSKAEQKRRRSLSSKNPGGPRLNPSGMPYGAGSIQVRGNNFWMIYRDGEGNIQQENTWTTSREEARKTLAVKAIETLEFRIASLREIVDEPPIEPAAETAGDGDGDGDAGASLHKGPGRADAGSLGEAGGLRASGGKGGV
jgi:hypothetical protein